jgi:hypothetical protein
MDSEIQMGLVSWETTEGRSQDSQRVGYGGGENVPKLACAAMTWKQKKSISFPNVTV